MYPPSTMILTTNTIRFSDEAFGELGQLSDLAWETLGRYIANNTHLEEIAIFENMSITDAKMALLFRGLTKSNSLQKFDLMSENHPAIGTNGIRSMVPFLKNSPNLSKLYL